MSKTTYATQIWLGEACSNEAFLSGHLAVDPNVVFEHLHEKLCDSLKYVQSKFPQHKHVETLNRNSDEFVQKFFSLEEADLFDY
jgi:hypothetical protein